MAMMMRIAALHTLPFDEKRFQRDLDSVSGHDADLRAMLETQYRENWNNAWIIVVEGDGVDIDLFSYPDRGPSSQAPWLERKLDRSGTMERAAFFMHFIDPSQPLLYGDQKLTFPAVSPAPEDLIDLMVYSSPD